MDEPFLTVGVLGTGGVDRSRLLHAYLRRLPNEAVLCPFDRETAASATWNGSLFRACWGVHRAHGRTVALALCPNHVSAPHDLGLLLAQCDAVVFAASAAQPLDAAAREHLLLALTRGLSNLAVVLDTGGVPSPDAQDAAERSLRKLLLDNGFEGDDVPVVRGDIATGETAHLDELRHAIETRFATPRRDEDAPFRLLVHSWDAATGDRVPRGRIARGRVAVGDMVEAIGPAHSRLHAVTALRCFGRSVREAAAGLPVAVELSRAYGPDFMPYAIEAGNLLATPGTVRLRRAFSGPLAFFRSEDGGRASGRYVMSGYTPSVWLPAINRKARLELLDRARAYPGETVPVRAAFRDARASYVAIGDTFLVRDCNRFIGMGTVERLE